MAKSLRSQSQASMRRSASSGASVLATPASAARPVCAAVSTISLASRSRRRRSRPSAWAYSSTRRSSCLLVFVEPGAGERRRQVAERDGGNAALGLGCLAGIGDDEGIDDRQRAGDDLGKAGFAQRHRLAGQPFQRAVGADMDDRVDAERLLQPEPEGEQRMARRQRRVVIVGAAVGRAAAIGGEGDGDVAEGRSAEGEARRPSCPVARRRHRLAFRRSPRGLNSFSCLSRQVGRTVHVVSASESSVPAGLDQVEQRARRFGNPFNAIAGVLQVVQHGEDAGGHVEADGIAGAAGRAGIVGNEDRELALVARRALQSADEGGDARARPARRGPTQVGWRQARKPSAGSSSLSALKEMAPARMRPSSSGSTTCMARSAGARPRWLPSQASRRVVATMTWKTGTPARSNRVSAPGSAPVAKAVAVTMAEGGELRKGRLDEGQRVRVLQARRRRSAPALMPCRSRASVSASMGATSAASSIER